ncbi:cold shock domain-containing protein [Acinetobacter beijerinckii]|uniref:cold shock domain-containing protein n=1 Tax=Acinetobacter beijerinckii TaxID=262668 RepID=UPI0023DD7DC8|nr:cold shock domain-containing protein [Acinetobacter beijerinckii]MDF2417009.1 cold shock domain-containing protein [Acinetobacter beijerinckii]
MFLEGKIKKYNSDRGFGFIELNNGQADVFFHIKDFPKLGGEPKVGETIKFLMVEDHGKFRAANIIRLDLKPEHQNLGAVQQQFEPNNSNAYSKTKDKKGITFTVVGLIVIAILLALIFQKYQSYQQAQQLKTIRLIEEQKQIIAHQREAIGDLPEVKRSEKTTDAIKTNTGSSASSQQPIAAKAQFSCDGRIHCSQMRSYDEALFFLRNCPNTQMDGNNDGEPCERQFGR